MCVVKVIPPSENSPRSRSRSPLKSPNSPTRLLPSSQSLPIKCKHPSPPGLYSNSVGSPARNGTPLNFRSPPASPTKMNSNSHVIVTASPRLPQSPTRSPLRLPVISKVMKSPPPLLPINHVKDSSSSLKCTEDPLAIVSRMAPSENVKSPVSVPQHQHNGLQDSGHKTGTGGSPVNTSSGGKASDGKFRTPKTPSFSLSPEIDLDPNDYRYMVEEVSSPENKLVVKPSQITRGKGVLTPKKVKIFLRNALHRISEKHPFTVKVCV